MNKIKKIIKTTKNKLKSKSKKIVVGISGGVDSAVALFLLKQQNFAPIGVFLKFNAWQNKKSDVKRNIHLRDKSIANARQICQRLDVPFFVYNVADDFNKQVVNYFVSELKNNRTPNPCVICNCKFKFKQLFIWAKQHQIKYVATGHYAKIKKNLVSQKYELLKAKDNHKDQTYFLSILPQRWLKNIIFPLGSYLKETVYQIAKKQKLIIKQESQDFCFVSKKILTQFLKKVISERPGAIIDSTGKILGKHRGLCFYTIGQRKRINLSNGPYFVKTIDVAENNLIVTKKRKEIYQQEIILYPCYFIFGKPLDNKTKVMAKIRSQQALSRAVIFPSKNKQQVKIIFAKPQLAVTPGQFCVFYQGRKCLGGGIIN